MQGLHEFLVNKTRALVTLLLSCTIYTYIALNKDPGNMVKAIGLCNNIKSVIMIMQLIIMIIAIVPCMHETHQNTIEKLQIRYRRSCYHVRTYVRT